MWQERLDKVIRTATYVCMCVCISQESYEYPNDRKYAVYCETNAYTIYVYYIPENICMYVCVVKLTLCMQQEQH